MENELRQIGDVTVVAPATEQSGVGHSITFLSPLICREVFDGDRRRGWYVEGSPADCVKIAVSELCESRPTLIVSGINHGLNAGINVLYSGTVAAAIEGAFFQITSIAVSLEYDEHADFERAASIAAEVIQQILQKQTVSSRLYNLNIPTVATQSDSCELRVVPMGLERYGESYLRRQVPKGRNYYWATGDPPPNPTPYESDLSELKLGHVTLTPLDYDLTQRTAMDEISTWGLTIDGERATS